MNSVLWHGVWNEDKRARVYFNKAHFGLKEPRRPLVQPDGTEPPAELSRYHRAITSGDRELLEEALHPDAVFHSPVGPLTAEQFIDAFSNPAEGKPGVPLQFCTITTGGDDHAVEFISWRRPPHGGLGVYSFDHGKLRSVRVYEGPVYR